MIEPHGTQDDVGWKTISTITEFLFHTRHCRGKLGNLTEPFDWLRKYAYREIRLWYGRREHGIYVAWLTHLYRVAMNFTANEHPTPLDHREVHHIAKSVSRWVWRHFSAEGFAAKQAARGRIGGRASGEARRGRTVERDAAIRADREAGMTQATIAAQYGISQGRVAQIISEALSDRSPKGGV